MKEKETSSQKKNYGRFYRSLHEVAGTGETAGEMKAELVQQYTDGRTTSLREMTPAEYSRCCSDLDALSGYTVRLKRSRSATLHLMQKLGVDTTDWTRVNAFCRDPRIAGKPFASLSIGEHYSLGRKLRSIAKSGGLKPRREAKAEQPAKQQPSYVLLSLKGGGQA